MERTSEFDASASADLTRTEARLFDVLRSRPDEVWTRPALLETMHGESRGNVQDHAITATVSRLRKDLGASGGCVETVRGRGYRWNSGYLSVDPASGAAFVGGRPVDLSPSEREVLADLASHPGRIRTPEQLGASFSEGTLRSLVASIRRKLETAGDCIETIHGRGYRFRPSAASGRVPPSVRRTVLLLALGVLLAAAGLGALRVYRAVTAPPVLAESPTEPVAEE